MMHWRHGQQTGQEALFSAYPIPYRRNYFMLSRRGRQGQGGGSEGCKRERDKQKGMPQHPFFSHYLNEVRLLLNFLYARYANFYATIRSQAGDQLSFSSYAVALGAGNRVGFATTFNGNFAGSHTFAY